MQEHEREMVSPRMDETRHPAISAFLIQSFARMAVFVAQTAKRATPEEITRPPIYLCLLFCLFPLACAAF